MAVPSDSVTLNSYWDGRHSKIRQRLDKGYLEPVYCKKQQKIVSDQLLLWGVGDL